MYFSFLSFWQLCSHLPLLSCHVTLTDSPVSKFARAIKEAALDWRDTQLVELADGASTAVSCGFIQLGGGATLLNGSATSVVFVRQSYVAMYDRLNEMHASQQVQGAVVSATRASARASALAITCYGAVHKSVVLSCSSM